MKTPSFLAALLLLELLAGSQAFTITCTFGNSIDYMGIGVVYECASVLTLSSANHTVSGIAGTHVSGKSHQDVKMINIGGGASLAFVPRGITRFFPNLQAFLLHSHAVEALRGDEFNDIPNLRWLAMNNGRLKSISSQLFHATRGVIYVNFGQNLIERVGHELFTPLDLTRLYRIGFYQNVCIDRDAWDGFQAIVDDLRRSCPYDGETLPTTTMPPVGPYCSTCNLFERLCALEEDFRGLQGDVAGAKRVQRIFEGRDGVLANVDGGKLEVNANEEIQKLSRKLAAMEEKIEFLTSELEKLAENL